MSESGNVGANSANSRQTSGSNRRTYWAAAVSVVAPPVMFIATGIGLLLVTNSKDPANTLGISDNLLNGFLIGLVGLLAGIVVGLVARMRDVVLPPLVGLFVGVATFLAFVAFEAGGYVELDLNRMVILWIGLSVSLFLATRLTGYALVGAATAAVVVGVGLAAYFQSLPQPQAEVSLILEGYTSDEATGECAGSGELSEIGEGSRMLLIDYETGEELASVILSAGVETDSGCRFELGHPLGLSAVEYGELIDVVPESGELGVGGSTTIEGRRVIFRMENG